MKLILIFITCTFLQNLGIAQSLIAEIKYPFIDGEEMGYYSGGIQIEKGCLSVNQIVEFTDEEKHKAQFKILTLRDYDLDNEVSSLGTGKSGFITMETVNKKKLPFSIRGAFSVGKSNQQSINTNKPEDGKISCKLDGQDWKGKTYYKCASYFPNGNTLLKTKKPYLIFSFKSDVDANVQFTLTFDDFRAGKSILNKNNFEFALSGTPDKNSNNICIASNWENGNANTKHTPFHFEFTKWEDKGDYILASGKFYGILYGFNPMKGLIGELCKNVKIEDGVFDDFKIEVVKQSF